MTSLLVEVWHGEEAENVALRLGEYIRAEPVKAAWLKCALRRGATDGTKYDMPLVWRQRFELIDSADRIPVAVTQRLGVEGQSATEVSDNWGGLDGVVDLEVRFGDDLRQRASWFAYRYDLSDGIFT